MMNSDPKRPVTLEDLLRLKRAERPPAEFWHRFDHELRAKQLAALVEKRPWWRAVPNVFGGLSRYQLPLGATAILALTVLTVREYRSAVPPVVSGPASAVAAAVTTVVPVATAAPVAAGLAVGYGESAAAAVDDENSAAPDNFGLASDATAPGQLGQMISVLGAGADPMETGPSASPAARFIAANLALAKAAEPAIAQNLLGAARGFEARAFPARSPVVDPLSQMASPAEVRRSRLLNGAVMSVSMNTMAPSRSSELRSRQISDEQLYDSISRFGARGNSVLVKF
jgi:hypothetical protein